MEIYSMIGSNNSQFFTTSDPDTIEESFVAYLRKLKIEPLISKEKYKIKFTRYGVHEFNHDSDDNVDVCLRIFKVIIDDTTSEESNCNDLYCVQFTKLRGNLLKYVK